MQREFKASRINPSHRLDVWAWTVFALCGVILQVAILMSGYWSRFAVAPLQTIEREDRPAVPTPAEPKQRRSVPIEPLAQQRDRA